MTLKEIAELKADAKAWGIYADVYDKGYLDGYKVGQRDGYEQGKRDAVVHCAECIHQKVVNGFYLCDFHDVKHLRTGATRRVHDYGINMGAQDFCSYGARIDERKAP